MTLGVIVLSDGTIFSGKSVGVNGFCVGEIVFNTAMSGYEEILTDPSYAQQIISFTSPHIGNTGINYSDQQSPKIWASGVIMREISPYFNHRLGKISLSKYLIQQKIVALTEIDTRQLTHIIREKGNLAACLLTGDDVDFALHQAKLFYALNSKNNDKTLIIKSPQIMQKPGNDIHFVVIDYGIKKSILTYLLEKGCNLTIVPAHTSYEDIMSYQPEGILLSNGPGDPSLLTEPVKTIQKIIANKIPLFAICLGHQFFALACGAKITKLKFGHHGANHPVYDYVNNKILISSQNHNYVVADDHLPSSLQVTHRSLFDNSIAGLKYHHAPAFSFQGHPEGNPGPHDCEYLFDLFINSIKNKLVTTTTIM